VVVSQSLMSGGREFQTEGAATENAHPAMSVRVRGTISSGSGAADDRSCLVGGAEWRMSLRYYDGADVVSQYRRLSATSIICMEVGGGAELVRCAEDNHLGLVCLYPPSPIDPYLSASQKG